jgi:hypothetical protein
MTLAGWIMMTIVVGTMTTLLIWCVWKVVTTPGSREHVHSAIELDTPDMHEP